MGILNTQHRDFASLLMYFISMSFLGSRPRDTFIEPLDDLLRRKKGLARSSRTWAIIIKLEPP